MLAFSLCSCVLLRVAAAFPNVHIPGPEASPNRYPWVVGLADDNNRDKEMRHHCGAALVADPGNVEGSRFIVTAAHCIVGLDFSHEEGRPVPNTEYRPIDSFTIFLGNHNYKEEERGEQRRKIKRMVYAPGWKGQIKGGLRHDVAVIQMDGPVQFTDTIKPIGLAEEGEELPTGATCTVAGWGRRDGDKKSDVLRHVNVTIEDNQVCHDEWMKENPHLKYDQSIMVCAGLGHQPTACAGDSGSPLVCPRDNGQWFAYGVANIGVGPCGRQGPPAGYGKIGAQRGWITQTIKEWSSSDK